MQTPISRSVHHPHYGSKMPPRTPSPVAQDSASNALGIFLQEDSCSTATVTSAPSNQFMTSSSFSSAAIHSLPATNSELLPSVTATPQQHVDPALIYHGLPVSSQSDVVTAGSAPSLIFSSPIHYPPYLGKRSLSDIGALKQASFSGKSKRLRTTSAESSTSVASSTSSSSSDISCSTCMSASSAVFSPVSRSPTTSPSHRPAVVFGISPSGQAIVRYSLSSSTSSSLSDETTSSPKQVIHSEITLPSSPPPATPHSLSVSAQAPKSSKHSRTATSYQRRKHFATSPTLSEAETEIADNPKLHHVPRSDARLAMARAIRRQQALLQVYRESTAPNTSAEMDVSASNTPVRELFSDPLSYSTRSSGKRNRNFAATISMHSKNGHSEGQRSKDCGERHRSLSNSSHASSSSSGSSRKMRRTKSSPGVQKIIQLGNSNDFLMSRQNGELPSQADLQVPQLALDERQGQQMLAPLTPIPMRRSMTAMAAPSPTTDALMSGGGYSQFNGGAAPPYGEPKLRRHANWLDKLPYPSSPTADHGGQYEPLGQGVSNSMIHASAEEISTRCVCGQRESYGESIIQCNACKCWLHMPCLGLVSTTQISGSWFCPFCTGAPLAPPLPSRRLNNRLPIPQLRL
ncbi:uncharacterized protein V1516DRAFT_667901 [Lipomyces oligophaga]|uniref:uncharacterized protein n=1 Tax=Lipomyces oligophaga TaxID=45792 RepID=UPI0034CD9400